MLTEVCERLALYSNHTVLEGYSLLRESKVQPAAVFVEGNFIQNIITFEEPQQIESLKTQFNECQWIDYSEFILSPGIIDLNASLSPPTGLLEFEETGHISSAETAHSPEFLEGYEAATRSAAEHGVTTIVETLPPLKGTSAESLTEHYAQLQTANLFTDIGCFANVTPGNLSQLLAMEQVGVCGFKAYLLPLTSKMSYFTETSLPHLYEAVGKTSKTLFFHAEIADERVSVSPTCNDEQPIPFAAAFSEDLVHSSSDESLSNSSTPSKDKFCRQVVKEEAKNLEALSKAEYSLYSNSGQTVFGPVQAHGVRRPPPISIIKRPSMSENSNYSLYLAQSPSFREVNAVKLLLASLPDNVHLHISNVSAAGGIALVQQAKGSKKVTCETSSCYLDFCDDDIAEGDTRFKVRPPIREHKNRENLRKLLQLGEIQTVTSYHQQVRGDMKVSGDFVRSTAGVYSIGSTLHSVLGSLEGDAMEKAVLAGKLLSELPAQAAGLTRKGGIAKGKLADLFVWDPLDSSRIEAAVSPFHGKQWIGKVHATMLHGALVYSKHTLAPKGQVLSNNFTL